MEKVRNTDQSAQEKHGLGSLVNANAIEQYGRRDNVRMFGADEETGENPYNIIIQSASDAGAAISLDDIIVCQPLPTRSSTQPIIAKFVRREAKSAVIQGTKVLKEKNVWVS